MGPVWSLKDQQANSLTNPDPNTSSKDFLVDNLAKRQHLLFFLL